VEKVESSRSVVLRPFVRWVTPTEVFASGDRVRFIDVPGSVVMDVRQISDIEELPTSDDRPRYRVTFDDPADVSVGQVADIPEHNSPNAIVRGSWFHDHAANGMRVKGNGWVVEGNAFEHIVSGNGVLALPTYWGPNWRESGWVDGLSVTDNVFRDIGSEQGGSAIAVGETDSSYNGHRDILIEGNVVDGTTRYGVAVENADGVQISDNSISGTAMDAVWVHPRAENVTIEP
jgi:hypothetical protein